jgi:hypothetical protein
MGMVDTPYSQVRESYNGDPFVQKLPCDLGSYFLSCSMTLL